MRVLVTGGAGLIGRAAVAHLLERNHEVVSVLRSPSQVAGARVPRLREAVGDAGDPLLLDELMNDIDCVLHLAAVPHPHGRTARELLVANSLTTMAVLEAAGSSGVTSVVIASSISILGMAWSSQILSPLSIPITEEHPLRPTEGYSLSKGTDEAIAQMASRRWGMSVASLRFPYTQSMEGIEATKLAAENDPSQALQSAKELWAYLDLRDASRACELALTSLLNSSEPGCQILNIVAPDLLLDESLSTLMRQWHPDYFGEISPESERQAYSTQKATEEIGFTAVHLIPRAAILSDLSAEGALRESGNHD